MFDFYYCTERAGDDNVVAMSDVPITSFDRQTAWRIVRVLPLDARHFRVASDCLRGKTFDQLLDDFAETRLQRHERFTRTLEVLTPRKQRHVIQRGARVVGFLKYAAPVEQALQDLLLRFTFTA